MNALFIHPQETWSAAKCARLAKRRRRGVYRQSVMP